MDRTEKEHQIRAICQLSWDETLFSKAQLMSEALLDQAVEAYCGWFLTSLGQALKQIVIASPKNLIK